MLTPDLGDETLSLSRRHALIRLWRSQQIAFRSWRTEMRAELGEQPRVIDLVIAERAFSTAFQPIVEIATGDIVGFEALTRFDDGALPKERFHDAGRFGLSGALETATLASAVEAAKLLPPGPWLAINVSPSMLLDAESLNEIVTGTDRAIVLELTEHDPIEDYVAVSRARQRLPHGVRLSVDDVGSGYSSLRHILQLRPDYIKLDREWVVDIDADPARQSLVVALADFASRTGVELIAEGVETRAELDTLIELGVCLAQGYLVGEPRFVG
ncbi:MAG TPA: EAL domain-containing protein [Acidimicrobiales bacterium]|nr:EAL domain-containing protein [Acidimicrobiales bacterium]